MSRDSRFMLWLIAVPMLTAAGSAQAQSNLDAGKSAAQIFSDTCSACHRSPRELRQTNAGFLREHYTTGGREAAAMAAYLVSVGSDPRAVQQRKPPGSGRGGTETAARPPASAPDQGRSPESQGVLPGATGGRTTAPAAEQAHASPGGAETAVKPRRPSDSMEAGRLPIAPSQENGAEPAPPQSAAAMPTLPGVPEAFEE